MGDRVRTKAGAVGVVQERREDGDLVVVAGALRIVARPDTVTLLEDAPSAHPAIRPSASSPVHPSATVRESFGARPVSEIKLLGLRVEEAEAVLTRALDEAIQADLPFLRIVHGKGTGALRDMVQRVLRGDRRVAHAGLAPANQGGSGVTVAEFRS